MSDWSLRTKRYRMQRADFLGANPVCWLCGVTGADSIDHYFPASLFPDLRTDMANWRPAHRACNNRRGNRMSTPQSRRSRIW